ncbi:MAG: hypothetical protein IT430_11090 [Phycisphaerales bacterium]|nr:hypothetical protein [Phycisphaerales bacterium]
MGESIHAASRPGLAARAAILTCAALVATGCGYRPGGQGWTGSSETWPSTEFHPATLTLVDVRTGEELWTQDIPVGYQMVTRFVEGGGPDKVERPDRLEYQIFLVGTKYGKLRSTIAVPPATCRRWELSYRDAPEYREPGVRNGLLGNMPPWWELPAKPLPDLDTDSGDMYQKQ